MMTLRRPLCFLGLAVGQVSLTSQAETLLPLRVTATTQVTAVENTYPSWSPEGDRIVFESTRDGDPEIFVMNSDGSDVRQLTANETVDGSPVFSPDGERIAFVTERDGNLEVYVMNADGTAPRNVSNHPGTDGHPKFSADGRYIVFNSNRSSDPSTFADGYMSADHNHEIYRVELSSGAVEQLTDHPRWDTYPELSPDGNWLVWRRVVEGRGRFADRANSEIFLKDLRTGEETNLSRHPDFDGWPGWSPDGRRIAFASNRAGSVRGSWDVYVMDITGHDVIRLTFGGGGPEGYFTKPDFAPDGMRMLATRTLGDSVETFILELTDTQVTTVDGN